MSARILACDPARRVVSFPEMVRHAARIATDPNADPLDAIDACGLLRLPTAQAVWQQQRRKVPAFVTTGGSYRAEDQYA